MYPSLALVFGVEPHHCPSSSPQPPILSPIRVRPRFITARFQRGGRSGVAGGRGAPLAQRPRSPPGGPRPGPRRLIRRRGARGGGAGSGNSGLRRGSGARLLLPGGARAGPTALGDPGFHGRKARPAVGVSVSTLSPSSPEKSSRKRVFWFLSARIPALEVQLCGWGAGSGFAWGSWNPRRRPRLHPPGGGGPRGEEAGGGAPQGRGWRRDRLPPGRRPVAALLEARPAPAPCAPLPSPLRRAGLKVSLDPSGTKQKTFPFPTPGSLLSFLAAAGS